MSAAPEEAVIKFLKRRYASAIGCGDDRTAARLRAELDRLMNGRAAKPDQAMAPELPPAA